MSAVPASSFDPVKIGIVSVSDRASTGVYEDKGLPALQDWLTRALKNPITFEPRLIPDEQARISQTLIELVDAGCSLVLTTGGTGPALRDVTPEATLAVAHKEMPGFGELFRIADQQLYGAKARGRNGVALARLSPSIDIPANRNDPAPIDKTADIRL